jgi:hypothetical protein
MTDDLVVPHLGHCAILQSYHFHRKTNIADWKAEQLPPGAANIFFLDSGAFSARNAGADIDPDEYARFAARNAADVDIVANLDVHMDASSNAAMLDRLNAQGANALPVVHPGIPWKLLEQYAEQYPFVLLGGMVGAAGDMMRWCDHAVRLLAKHGSVAHGFGQTNVTIASNIPFWSCDSTSWLSGVRYGNVALWTGKKLSVVNMGDHDNVKRHAPLLLEAGVPAQAVKGDVRINHHLSANISFVAFRRWAKSIRDKNGPVSMRDGSLPDGFHLFMAGGWDYSRVDWMAE